MAHEVLMPKLSSTMSEGTITMWLKNEGDSIDIGEPIFEVMTDKIAIEVEAYEEGILLKRYIENGQSAPVNAVIAYIGQANENVPDKMPEIASESIEVSNDLNLHGDVSVSKEENTCSTNASTAVTNVRATPSARRIAREKGILLNEITGSGPKGRIQATDVKNYTPINKQTTVDKVSNLSEKGELIPWSGMRQVISDRMVTSKTTIPHVTMTAEVDFTKVIELRKQILPMVEETVQERISYLEIIAKASMVALKNYPIFNAHGLEEGIQLYSHINLGIAVAIEDGLVVPVIPHADQMGLNALTQSVKEKTKKARNGELKPSEMSGGTFTISSLGRTKVNSFNPIINAPEVAILGIGGVYKQLILDEETKEVKNQASVNLSLSFDHRVVDGAPAAAFLSQIVQLLENPLGLLL